MVTSEEEFESAESQLSESEGKLGEMGCFSWGRCVKETKCVRTQDEERESKGDQGEKS